MNSYPNNKNFPNPKWSKNNQYISNKAELADDKK